MFDDIQIPSEVVEENSEIKFNLNIADLNDDFILDLTVSENLWSSNAEK